MSTLKKLLTDTTIKAQALAHEEGVEDEAAAAAEQSLADLTPAARLTLAGEMLAALPLGRYPEIDLGSGAEPLAALLAIGAARKVIVYIEPGRTHAIEQAEISVGPFRVRAELYRDATFEEVEAAAQPDAIQHQPVPFRSRAIALPGKSA